MAKCKQCKDGAIECGPNSTELCQDSGGFEFAGVFCFRVLVATDTKGKCKVRIVPCIPKGQVECEKPPKATTTTTGKTAKKAARRD